LRLIVACALLAFVFHIALPQSEVGLIESIVSAWSGGPFEAGSWFLIALVIFAITFAIGALRFSTLLRGAGFDIGWRILFRAYLVAGFFNLVLPGAILGDAYRLWDVRREEGKGSRALGIIAVERLLSLSALGCLGLVAAPFIPLETSDRSLVGLLMGLCGVIAIGAAGLCILVPTLRCAALPCCSGASRNGSQTPLTARLRPALKWRRVLGFCSARSHSACSIKRFRCWASIVLPFRWWETPLGTGSPSSCHSSRS
jgi:hypothetical protein